MGANLGTCYAGNHVKPTTKGSDSIDISNYLKHQKKMGARVSTYYINKLPVGQLAQIFGIE